MQDAYRKGELSRVEKGLQESSDPRSPILSGEGEERSRREVTCKYCNQPNCECYQKPIGAYKKQVKGLCHICGKNEADCWYTYDHVNLNHVGGFLFPWCRRCIVLYRIKRYNEEEENLKKSMEAIGQEEFEISIVHATTRDPRSIESAKMIAKKLWARGVDTRVERLH